MTENPADPGSTETPGQDGPDTRSPSSRTAALILAPLVVVVLILAWSMFWFRDTGHDDFPETDHPRHVIVILTDTTRRDSFGCYGAARPVTPRMDEIAAQGVRFDQVIAQSSWTLPAVTTILTSTYPSIHGAQGKFTGPDTTTFHRSRPEISHGPELLEKRRVKTHAIVNAGFLDPVLGLDRGFAEYDFYPGYNWQVRRADASVDAAIKFMQENQRRNTFLFLHLFDPHLNYDPPGPFKEMFAEGYKGPFRTLTPKQTRELIAGMLPADPPERSYLRGEYDAEILFMDRQVGRLVDSLRTMGLYDRTMLVIIADHGEEFWDHDGFEHGHTMYQELILVPMIVKLPARYRRARAVVVARVQQIDIMPTVFEVLGLEPPESFQGRSLLPLMIEPQEPEDRSAYSESTLYGVDQVAFFQGPYKYILDLGDGSGELYDLPADPLETNNLLASRPEQAQRMRLALQARREALRRQAEGLSPPVRIDMANEQHKQLKEQLKSLGYLRGD